MGKRELLLVVVFAIVGVVVYQVTAPPPAPGERSFSLSQIVNNIRREVRGNRASAEITTPSAHAVAPSVTALRLSLLRGDITIIGEDRDTIAAELHVRSNGYDVPEAERLAKETVLKLETAGETIIGTVEFPEAGRQTASLSLKVPARLAIRLEPGFGDLKITNVAGLELVNGRGTTQVGTITGRVIATQTGGEISITNAGSLKLTTRGADAMVEHVRGDSSFSLRNGEFKGKDVVGPIDVDANGTDITFEQLQSATGTLRINAVNGTVTLLGLKTEGRIDSRGAEVNVDIERAAPLAIYADGNDDVTVTAPAGGYQLDAVAENGRVSVPEGTLQVTVNGEEQRASGAVRGGAAGTITIRSKRGDVTVKDRAK